MTEEKMKEEERKRLLAEAIADELHSQGEKFSISFPASACMDLEGEVIKSPGTNIPIGVYVKGKVHFFERRGLRV